MGKEQLSDWLRERSRGVSMAGVKAGGAGAASTALFSTLAVAQTEQATTVCQGTGWNLFIATILLVNAAAWMICLTALGLGLGLVSLGGLGRKFRSMGTTTMMLVMIGSFIYLITTSMVGVAYAAGPINVPTECVLPF